MFTPLVLVLVVLGVVVAVLALIDVARDREPGWGAVGTLAVLEVGLVVQVVLGFVALANTDREVNGLTFSGYLVGTLLVPPAAFLWAVTERSRWGTAVVAIGGLAVLALESRLNQIWGG